MGNTATSGKRDRNFSYSIDGYTSNRPNLNSNDDQKLNSECVKKKTQFYYPQQSIDFNEETEEYKKRIRSNTISEGTSIDENSLPAVFKWEGGGKDVYIKGTFSNWKPIKMSHSHGDFVAIVNIPEGNHEYKYIVDGNEKLNDNAKINETSRNNVINVKKSDFEVFEALAMDLASNAKSNEKKNSNNGSPRGSYSQNFPSTFDVGTNWNKKSSPPVLPPHLLQVILNNPNVSGEPTLLPQPNHVMLNHLYALSIKEGVMVLSCTHRYRKKYVTTLLYKPFN